MSDKARRTVKFSTLLTTIATVIITLFAPQYSPLVPLLRGVVEVIEQADAVPPSEDIGNLPPPESGERARQVFPSRKPTDGSCPLPLTFTSPAFPVEVSGSAARSIERV